MTINGWEVFCLYFRLPLRYRLPLPWSEFNSEARDYVARKRKRQISRIWIRAGKDFQQFNRIAHD